MALKSVQCFQLVLFVLVPTSQGYAYQTAAQDPAQYYYQPAEAQQAFVDPHAQGWTTSA